MREHADLANLDGYIPEPDADPSASLFTVGEDRFAHAGHVILDSGVTFLAYTANEVSP